MENNNNPIINKMPETVTVQTQDTGNTMVQKPSKKKKIIILIAIFALFSLLITYLFLNSIKTPERIPTMEEKIQNIENAVNETAKIGLPDKKTQIDIMNYNQAE